MIELNFTLIFQLILVLILMVVLSQIVFKPFLSQLQERRDWVEGAERKARELQQRADELMEKYREAISAAQAQGASIREGIRKESLAQEAEILRRAAEEANRFIGEMKGKIQEEAHMARAHLRVHAQKLAREIAEKVLGRSLQ